MNDEGTKWKKRFERERLARREAEQLLEDKSLELYQANRRLEDQIQNQGSKLAEQEELFASVFHAAMDGIILLNQRGRVIEANHAALRMLGYSRDQIIGTPVPRLVSEKDKPTARDALRQVIKTGYCRYEANLIRIDASTFPAEIVGSRARVGGKTIIKGTIRDITQRLRNLAELKQARDEAEKANEAKSLFLASMSHEIRTPLNGVLGFTEMVLESDLTPEQRRHLELVQSSGDILLHVINDILDFSRIESGKLLLEEKRFSIRKMIGEVVAMQSEVARKKSLELSSNISGEVPEFVKGDIVRIQQVTTNLISNALKFTNQGSVKVLVECDPEWIKISVVDTGIGFDESKSETLFESFTQADVSTTRKYGGTGLGLTISRTLARQMKGDIEAHGDPENGARFIFKFPLIEPTTHPTKEAEVPQLPEQKPNLQSNNQRVLVAEDNKVNARLIVLMLSRTGYAPEVVSNGVEVIEKLREDPDFSVILMDRHMHLMDGIEATQRIRQGDAGEACRKIPIIAVTASTLTEDRERCLEVGMNGFLAKPLRPRDLTTQLSLVLGSTTESA